MSESNHHTSNDLTLTDLQVTALILDVELWCVDPHVVVAVTEQRGHRASRLGGGGPGGGGGSGSGGPGGGSRGRVAEATSRCLEPDPATTELTVWETRDAIWEKTWLTTSLRGGG